MVVGAVVVVVGAAGLVAGVPGEPLDPAAVAVPEGDVVVADGDWPDGLTRGAVAERGRVVVAR